MSGKSARPAAGAPARVRIVGGAWRRTPIPVVDVAGLRPTPDRVRETLFNWLGQDLDGWRVLDLFAGTGALGFEAASRGAAEVVVVERDPRALAALHALRTRLDARQVRVEAGDATQVARRLAALHPARFDLVLLDPPFGQEWPQRVRELLPGLLAPGGWVYLEAECALDADAEAAWCSAGFEVRRQGCAGRVHYHLLGFQPASRAGSPAGAVPGAGDPDARADADAGAGRESDPPKSAHAGEAQE